MNLVDRGTSLLYPLFGRTQICHCRVWSPTIHRIPSFSFCINNHNSFVIHNTCALIVTCFSSLFQTPILRWFSEHTLIIPLVRARLVVPASFHEVDSSYEERKLHFRTIHLDVIEMYHCISFWKSALTCDVWHEGNGCINASKFQNPLIQCASVFLVVTWKSRLWLHKQEFDINASISRDRRIWRMHWGDVADIGTVQKIRFGFEDPRLIKVSDLMQHKNFKKYLCLPSSMSHCTDGFLDHLTTSVCVKFNHFVQLLFFWVLVMISVTLLCVYQCFPAYQ